MSNLTGFTTGGSGCVTVNLSNGNNTGNSAQGLNGVGVIIFTVL